MIDNFDNHDIVSEWVSRPTPDGPHWALTITMGFVLALVLWTVAPVQPEVKITPEVAQAIGLCGVSKGK